MPGVNRFGSHRRQAFAEFTEVYQIEADFQKEVETGFSNMINRIVVENV